MRTVQVSVSKPWTRLDSIGRVWRYLTTVSRWRIGHVGDDPQRIDRALDERVLRLGPLTFVGMP